MPHSDDRLNGVAEYLHAARQRILQSWHDSVSNDSELTTASVISRTQFNDHIPQILDAFEHRLRAHDPEERRQAHVEQRENAAEHGLHRWQQGYDQREAMREWGHLHICVLRELEQYAVDHDKVEDPAMPVARAALVRLCAEGVCESASRYARLQQAEAAGRVQDLERALQQLQELERQRAEAWREAAHDLRGTVSVIANASALVTSDTAADAARAQGWQMLRQNITSLRELLSDLMDQARLEAGQEQRKLAAFDAGQLLMELCESLRSVAANRNLFLKSEGPRTLLVEGDATKVRRIVQNLLLNALGVTEEGGVRVTWQIDDNPAASHWIVCVQDTGPGFDAVQAAPLEQVLKQATVASQAVEMRAGLSGEMDAASNPAPTLAAKSQSSTAHHIAGEGIGLSIVKRLCELLDVSIELQTSAGSGTTFRLIFPSQYQRASTIGGPHRLP